MPASAFRYNRTAQQPHRRQTNRSNSTTSSRTRTNQSHQNLNQTRYRRIIEEQIGILNLLRRHTDPGFIECTSRNRDSIQSLSLDSNKANALQFWVLFGSILQIAKAVVEFLQTINPDLVDSAGAASQAASMLNVIGTMVLLYPTVEVCKWYLLGIFCSYKRGFINVYGRGRQTSLELGLRAAWHTTKELCFVRSDDVVKPQKGKDWVLEIIHSTDPPLPIREPKVPTAMWKRLHALTDEEFERTLRKPNITSQLGSGVSSSSSGSPLYCQDDSQGSFPKDYSTSFTV